MHLLVSPKPVGSRLLVLALLGWLGCRGPLRIPGVLEELVNGRNSICLILLAANNVCQVCLSIYYCQPGPFERLLARLTLALQRPDLMSMQGTGQQAGH